MLPRVCRFKTLQRKSPLLVLARRVWPYNFQTTHDRDIQLYLTVLIRNEATVFSCSWGKSYRQKLVTQSFFPRRRGKIARRAKRASAREATTKADWFPKILLRWSIHLKNFFLDFRVPNSSTHPSEPTFTLLACLMFWNSQMNWTNWRDSSSLNQIINDKISVLSSLLGMVQLLHKSALVGS